MRKFYSVAIALLMVVSLIGFSQAQSSGDRNVQMYTIVNTGTLAQVTAINATNETAGAGIVPGIHQVIGVVASPYLTSSQPAVALIDNASMTNATVSYTVANGLFAEKSAGAAGASAEMIFPYPKRLSKGLTISQTNSSVVTVYYERYVP